MGIAKVFCMIHTRGGKAPIFDNRRYGSVILTAPERRGEAKLADELDGFDMGEEKTLEDTQEVPPPNVEEEPTQVRKKSGLVNIQFQVEPDEELLRALRFKMDGSFFDKTTQKQLRATMTKVAEAACERARKGLLEQYREALKAHLG
jgi:hypothetical protein